jgi:NTP pyrophosphatase (non-canonical NTP hydrolase)
MERFQWLSPEQSQAIATDPDELARVTDELADVLIYCLSLSNVLNLDLTSAVEAKLAINEHRYPADSFRGRFRRPTRDQ